MTCDIVNASCLCAIVNIMMCVVCALVAKILTDNCQQYVMEHQEYESGCQAACDWLTVSRDQLDSCVNITGNQQRLESAQNVLAVTTYCLLPTICREVVLTLCGLILRSTHMTRSRVQPTSP